MRRASPIGERRNRCPRQVPQNKRLDHRRVAPEDRFRRPRLYSVGEAPGAVEAAQGKPFVGPAGNALRRMLK
jgi:uracil-DNA glycosylase